jgi:enamine deaminase RidA (YjgF/YER057c/UK114 family)
VPVEPGLRRHRDGTELEQIAGYSRAVRRHGHIAVSGTTATGADGTALHPGDTYLQTRAALEKALSAVGALGGKAGDVVRTRIFLAPEANWESAARAHADLLGEIAPANTMLHVSKLIGNGFLVEVEIDAETDGA